MADLAVAKAALDRIDWNFPRSGTSIRSIHTTHWFPGNFIPQMPAALIQILSEPGNLVLDPFAGSGTTGFEAWKLGRRSIVADRLSSCVTVMRGKLALAQGLPAAVIDELFDKTTWEHECVSNKVGTNGEGSAAALTHWFSENTLAQLRYLWALVEVQAPPVRAGLTLLFSDVLFACASSRGTRTASGGLRRHHWGWVADNVLPKEPVDHDAIAGFRERLSALKSLDPFPSDPIPMLVTEDARQIALASESVDLVVTSPPYVGVIDYAHANRLLYAWMNWRLDEERADEIGARFKRFRRSATQEYRADMDRCWSEVERVLKPGGYCAIVIGESRKFPGSVEETMSDLARRIPLVWGPAHRVPSRRRVSDRAASQASEYIFVCRKPG